MLTAIGDLVKGTFSESLRRPLQPSGLFAAAIFVALNLVLIYPVLIEINYPLALTLRDAGGPTQTFVGVLVVLIVSYVLSSLTSTILKLMSGELWWDSAYIGRRLTAQFTAERTRIRSQSPPAAEVTGPPAAKVTDPPTPEQRAAAAQRLRTDFPDEEVPISPTALGNVLGATTSYVLHRYGIQMSALWPHLETVLSKDSALAVRLNEEKATLDFLLNFAFVVNLFAVEFALVRFMLRESEAWWALAFIVVAWAIYRVAVSKTRVWGALVRMAFDLHRDDLRRALGIRPFQSVPDEQNMWKRVSAWLAVGETTPEDAFTYVPADPPLEDADFITSENVHARFVQRPARGSSDQPIREYVLLVTLDEFHGDSGDFYVIVTDSGVADAKVEQFSVYADRGSAEDTWVAANDRQRLRDATGWSVQILSAPVCTMVWAHTWPGGRSVLLRYMWTKSPPGPPVAPSEQEGATAAATSA